LRSFVARFQNIGETSSVLNILNKRHAASISSGFNIIPNLLVDGGFESGAFGVHQKHPIGGEKCYKIFDTSNTLCTRTSGGTKKIYCSFTRSLRSL